MARKKKDEKTGRADGRLKRSFTIDGKRYYAYGRTQKELNANMDKKKADIREGRYVRAENLTMDQYFDRWEKNREGTVKPATIRNQRMWYQAISKAVIDNAGTFFGALRIREIEKQNIVDLQSALKSCCHKDEKTKKFNTNTINSYISLVKHILTSAVDDEIISKNVAKSVKSLKRTEKKARNTIHRALTKAETQAFFQAASESWYLNHFKFMLYTGCRCGEVGALNYADINRKEKKIEIRRTITKNEIGGYEVGASAKTADGIRDIPLTDNVLETITAQKELQSLFNHSLRFDGLIFTSPEGQLLNDTCVNREIERICKAAGIERFTAHAFRDTFATRAIESGMNPKTLQEILGHADIGITMNLYCHVMDETKVNEMNNINMAI